MAPTAPWHGSWICSARCVDPGSWCAWSCCLLQATGRARRRPPRRHHRPRRRLGRPAAIAPTIATQPASQTVASGEVDDADCRAAGTAPLLYQWDVGESGIVVAPVPEGTSTVYTTSALATTTRFGFACRTRPAAPDSQAAMITVTWHRHHRRLLLHRRPQPAPTRQCWRSKTRSLALGQSAASRRRHVRWNSASLGGSTDDG